MVLILLLLHDGMRARLRMNDSEYILHLYEGMLQKEWVGPANGESNCEEGGIGCVEYAQRGRCWYIYYKLCHSIVVAIVFHENQMANIIMEVCAVCAAIGLALSGKGKETMQHARDDTAAQTLRITTVGQE